MVEFVADISEVVVCPGQSVVKYIFDAFCVVAVNVLIACKFKVSSISIVNLPLWLQDQNMIENWAQFESLATSGVLRVGHVI